MYFMNEHDIDEARRRWADHPVLGPATQTLSNLRDAVNGNSDGWPYSKAPGNAAKQLMMLIQGDGTYRYLMPPRDDVTREALREALAPLKSFRTRSGLPFEIVENLPAPQPAQEIVPSEGWRILDHEDGSQVKRSSEDACREWLRAQDSEHVRLGRYEIVPPDDVTAECPNCRRRLRMPAAAWEQGPVLCAAPRADEAFELERKAVEAMALAASVRLAFDIVENRLAADSPSPSWHILDRDTGTTVDRSSEGACLEWVRSQAIDDVAQGRYRVIPPADPVTAECPTAVVGSRCPSATGRRGQCCAPRHD